MIRCALLLAPMLLALSAHAEEPAGLPRLVDSPALNSAFQKAQVGEVELLVDVEADGTLDHIRILHSTPPGVFDDAALGMVKGQRISPTTRDGVAQPLRDHHIVLKFQASADQPAVATSPN
jgi:TonB family protein